MTVRNQEREKNIDVKMKFIREYLASLAEAHNFHRELVLYENPPQRSGVRIDKIKDSGEPGGVFGRVEFDHDFLDDHDLASIEKVFKDKNFNQLFPTLPNSTRQTLFITANGTVLPPM